MKGSSLALVLIGLVCLLAVALADQGAQATASASAVAKAEASGGNAVATAKAEATASAGVSGERAVNSDALAAWRTYISLCSNKNYNRKLTPPGVCSNLAGNLCSRKDVDCTRQAVKTDFLNTSGAWIARGDNEAGTLSY